jgi:hypothetical protein
LEGGVAMTIKAIAVDPGSQFLLVPAPKDAVLLTRIATFSLVACGPSPTKVYALDANGVIVEIEPAQSVRVVMPHATTEDTRDRSAWIRASIKHATKRVKERVGGARLELVTAEMREALLCYEIVMQLLGQDESLYHTPIATWIELARQALADGE